MSSSSDLKDPNLDIEKGVSSPDAAGAVDTEVLSAEYDGYKHKGGVLGALWKAARWLDSFGVEVRGVERVPENERHHTSYADSGYLWASANCTISTLSLGTLGNKIFYLGATDACLVILFFNLLTTLPVALFSTWGKSTGLRQMIIGRYSFGPWTILFPIALNCLACIGWSTINTIVGASALKAVSASTAHELPEPAGIVIIAIITLAVALFGYRWVHLVERYSSIPVFVIFIIMYGQAGRFMSGGFGGVGTGEAGNILSFGGTIAGFALGWTSLAADYTVNFPVETPSWKVFTCTYAGLNFPLIFVECLGALLMSTFDEKPSWQQMYNDGGLGGLISAPLVGPMGGFGRFLVVILALSIVANNIPNVYSFALTFQAFGKYMQRIPRFFLCILCTIIYIILAEVGYNSFEEAFDTLLVILSYWLAIYSVILIEEHYIFRGGSFAGYNLDEYNTYNKLPVGIAAGLAVGFGVMGAVLGMSQTWYVGKIGILAGEAPFGGDVGFELAAGFSGLVYPLFRYIEKKQTGR
ncbi:hypothetical protein JCM8097_001605 [Rhodosporidiobolus ruineniae]